MKVGISWRCSGGGERVRSIVLKRHAYIYVIGRYTRSTIVLSLLPVRRRGAIARRAGCGRRCLNCCGREPSGFMPNRGTFRATPRELQIISKWDVSVGGWNASKEFMGK